MASVEAELGPEAPATRQSGPAPADERSLIAAARRGDRAAAEALVDSSYTLVYRSLLKLCGDEDTAADLTQDAYARAWAAIGGFKSRARFSTWMYRIAYTTFLNHVRRPQRFQDLEPEALEAVEDPAVSDPALQLDGRRLRQAVLTLPEELRFAITARYWGDVPVREIARHEGLTTVAIRKRLRRAIQMLGREFSEERP